MYKIKFEAPVDNIEFTTFNRHLAGVISLFFYDFDLHYPGVNESVYSTLMAVLGQAIDDPGSREGNICMDPEEQYYITFENSLANDPCQTTKDTSSGTYVYKKRYLFNID